MAKTSFILQSKKNSRGEKPIRLYFSYDGFRLKYATGQFIKEKDWNPETYRARRSYIGYDTLNGLLDSLQDKINELYRKAKISNTPLNNDYLTSELHTFNGKAISVLNSNGHKSEIEINHPKSFEDYFNDFLNEKGKEVVENTVMKYKQALKKIKDYCSDKRRPLIFSNVLTKEFYLDFREYYAKEGYNNETISKDVTQLKTFFRWCLNNDIITDGKYRDIYKPFAKNDLPVHALSNDELFQVLNFDFSPERNWDELLKGLLNAKGEPLKYSPSWAEIRDVFCFSSMTALRYSDYFAMQKENITGSSMLYTVKKTKDTHSVSFNHFAIEILKRYNNELPKYSNPYFNREIKEVGQVVGLNQVIIKIKYIGKLKIETKLKRWETLTHHLGRKTYATLSLQRGMRQEVVAKQGNWKKLSTMQKYINVAEAVIQEENDTAWSSSELKKKMG